MLKHLWYRLKRKKPQAYQPVVLVTGCASGIGLSLARLLCACPEYRLVITAREGKSLDFLRQEFKESETCRIRPLDVTSEASRTGLINEIDREWGGVNILVNNAGISYRAVVEHMTEEDELRQMSTNYLGPMGMIRAALPMMRTRGRGKIINVSSVSGMLAMPTMASYSASKYALEGASEALWYEMKPLGINVVLVQPGFVNSSSFKHVYFTEKSKPGFQWDDTYQDYYKNMTPFVEKMMSYSISTPEWIARLILKAIKTENPPLWLPATPDAYVFYYLRRFLPRRWLLPLLFFCLPNAKNWAKAYTRKRSSA